MRASFDSSRYSPRTIRLIAASDSPLKSAAVHLRFIFGDPAAAAGSWLCPLGARRLRLAPSVIEDPEGLRVVEVERSARVCEPLLHEGAHVPLSHLADVRLEGVDLPVDGVGDVNRRGSTGRPEDPRLLELAPRLEA